MDGTRQTDGGWGMSAPKMSKKYRLDAKTAEIEAQNAVKQAIQPQISNGLNSRV
jgi:hypothetical protein